MDDKINKNANVVEEQGLNFSDVAIELKKLSDQENPNKLVPVLNEKKFIKSPMAIYGAVAIIVLSIIFGLVIRKGFVVSKAKPVLTPHGTSDPNIPLIWK